MCGIVGAIAQRDVVDILFEGLRRLEYRGYDSAGVAILKNGNLERVRSVGKVEDLVRKSADYDLSLDSISKDTIIKLLTEVKK